MGRKYISLALWQTTWLMYLYCYLKLLSNCLTCTHYFFRCAQDSWPYSESDIINSTNVIFGYTTAFYFGVTTMTQTGYGDLLPRSVAEQVLIIFTMCIGFIVWNICVVTITANLMNNSYFKLVMYMHTYSTWYSWCTLTV